MNTETPDADTDAMHEALRASIRAILLAHKAAAAKLTPEQQADLQQQLDNGKTLALFVALQNGTATAELAVVASEVGDVFVPHVLKLSGSVVAAAAPAGDVRLINLAKLN